MAAQQFYNAAEYIWNSTDLDLSGYVYPLVVNYAFSCELSLKSSEATVQATNVQQGQLIPAAAIKSSVRGHELDSVFQDLKQETQIFLQNEFFSNTGEQLMPLLKECSKYFENCRYSFEKKSGSYNLSGVRTLAKGLLDSVMAYGEI